MPPLFLVMNGSSGKETEENFSEILCDELRQAGHHVTLHEIEPGSDLKKSCSTFMQHAKNAGGLVVAAGGDGTVNGVAALCYEHRLPLGIIPMGTFNYFARDLGIPTERDKAISILSDGMVRPVAAGFVQDHLFLNNASFGLYPTIIRKREQATARFGRKRIVGALSALNSLIHAQRLYTIDLNSDGTPDKHITSMVFIGNNVMQLENLGLDVSTCTKNDKLAVVILQPVNRIEKARLIWRGIVKTLNHETRLAQFCADDLVVNMAHKRIEVVVDGEIIACSTPLSFRIEASALNVMVPVTKEV